LTSHGATETPELKIKIDSVVRTVELGSVEDLEIALITTPEETSKRAIHKRSLLHIAALLGRVDHWKVLIDRLNPNEKDELGYTPLNYIQTNPLNHLFRILQLSPTTHR
jgi:ankyrin repeat protein